jgi:hypothetical protein
MACIAASALAVLLALLAAPAPTPAAVRSSCAERDSTTVRDNSVARVYRDGDDAFYSCSKRTGHREFLGDDVMGTVAEIRLRGHWVAYAFEYCLDALGDECERGIALEDVRSGRTRYSEAVPWDLVRIVLRRNGSLAWAVDDGLEVAVYRRAAGRRQPLDRGEGIEVGSLRLRGSTLSWVNGGARRSAELR